MVEFEVLGSIVWNEVAPEKGAVGQRWIGKAGHVVFSIVRPSKRHQFRLSGSRRNIQDKDFGGFKSLEEAQAKAERMMK